MTHDQLIAWTLKCCQERATFDQYLRGIAIHEASPWSGFLADELWELAK